MAQFFGFLLFACIATLGFWVLTFLISFLPYWIFADKLQRPNAEKDKSDTSKSAPMGERIWVKS